MYLEKSNFHMKTYEALWLAETLINLTRSVITDNQDYSFPCKFQIKKSDGSVSDSGFSFIVEHK
jgi:hypothetical protein